MSSSAESDFNRSKSRNSALGEDENFPIRKVSRQMAADEEDIKKLKKFLREKGL